MKNTSILHFLSSFAVWLLFSSMVSGWVSGLRQKICPGCITETVRCRKLILSMDIGWRGCVCVCVCVGVQHHGVIMI